MIKYIIVALFCLASSLANAQTTVTMGDTNIENINDSGNGNLLLAQRTTLSTSATIQSISFRVRTAGGNLNLGVYDATGPNGGPGRLVASAATFVPQANQWNTVPVTQQVTLAAGTYWLAYFPSSNTLGFQNIQGAGQEVHVGRIFGPLPVTFPTTGLQASNDQWSFYASLVTTTTPPPPPPPPPQGLTATPISPTEIDLSWAAVTGAVAYDVYRNGSKIATVTTTNYADIGLTPSTQYSYTIDNVSSQSNAVSATTPGTPPPPPPPGAGVVPFEPLHVYYTSPSGNDNNNGLTPATAWLSPDHSVVCGDVIIGLAGNYTAKALGNSVSNCPSSTGGTDGTGGIYFAVWLCAGPDLNSCNINAVSTGGVAVRIDGNNWAIEGFRINGNGGPDSRGIESNACASGTTINHHHAAINNVIFNARTAVNTNECALNHNVPGNGTDYWAAIGNIGQNSNQDFICVGAFDVVAPAQFDSSPGTHYIMYGNYAFNNIVPNCPSDGEAYMFDTFDAHKVSTLGVIQNNIGVKSERMGIQIFYQDINPTSINAVITNNTLFANNVFLHNDFSVGDLNIQSVDSTLSGSIKITNNISVTDWPWQGNGTSNTGGSVYALQVGGNYAALSIGGVGSENVFKGKQTGCRGSSCDPGFNVAAFNGGSFGLNTYVDPVFANPTDLLNNQMGIPVCSGFKTTAACMGWDANTQTLTTPSLISDLTPTTNGMSGKGYQLPSVACAPNPLYPVWLKGIVKLEWNPSTLKVTENSDLVTKPCGL